MSGRFQSPSGETVLKEEWFYADSVLYRFQSPSGETVLKAAIEVQAIPSEPVEVSVPFRGNGLESPPKDRTGKLSGLQMFQSPSGETVLKDNGNGSQIQQNQVSVPFRGNGLESVLAL